MVKQIKKGKLGQASKYVTRAKAIRKLQLSLPDFRRACILKGVYPREPAPSLKKTGKIYYHKKDILYLLHDPISRHFGKEKVLARKLKHYKAKKEKLQAESISRKIAKPDLSGIIRERYPRFEDALRDLQDPLCTVSLYASFQSEKTLEVENQDILASARVLREWQLYVIATGSLRKAFLSIKGIYYQAEVQSVRVNWLVPYKYPPKLPEEVDYRVMNTFLELYLVMLRFLLFRLFTQLGYQYPLQADESEAVLGSSLKSLLLQPISNPDKLIEREKYGIQTPLPSKGLFSGLTFFVSSECPKESLQFIILAKGGKVFMSPQACPADCTHMVTQRVGPKDARREYVQPQWVFDSVNLGKLVAAKDYQPGQVLPPHLSPWEARPAVEQADEDKQQKLEMAKSMLSRKQRSELRRKQIIESKKVRPKGSGS